MHAPGKANLNLYAYVKGAVLKAIDPLGLADNAAVPVDEAPPPPPAEDSPAVVEEIAKGLTTTSKGGVVTVSGLAVIESDAKPDTKEDRIEFLLMGPYKDAGGDHPYGHTALTLTLSQPKVVGGETGTNFTFDYGRYGKTWGFQNSAGEGIMRLWTNEREPYIQSEKSLGRYVRGYQFGADAQQADSALKFFQDQVSAAKDLGADPEEPLAHRFRLQTDYGAAGPNCTTISADGFNQGFPRVNLNTDLDLGRLGLGERAALLLKGTPSRVIMPLDLEHSLERQVTAGAAIKFEY